ncbi:MAG: aromatic amino acid ammonia-lyase, partial [Thermoanaerobaculia bacterium]
MTRDPRPVHELSLDRYTLRDLGDLEAERPRLALASGRAEVIERGARFVQRMAREDRHVYGVNTGFGSLCETRIEPDQIEQLQRNLVLSHACGVGEIVAESISRLTLLIKLLTFRTGHTGISIDTVSRLLDFWNHDLIPAIPKKGTVGASGDLAPLAHLALPLLGLGRVHRDGEIVDGGEALAALGWQPLVLQAKEGLALTNGVQYINAFAVQCVLAIGELIAAAEVIAAISIQAYSASRTFYDPLYHRTSYHRERQRVAANLSQLLAGSNHFELETCNRSQQDPYSLRCIPQVHGAVRQAH